MDTKELIGGDMKMGEGERGSPVQMRRRAAQPACLSEIMRGLRRNSQLWPARSSVGPAVPSRSSIPWLSPGPSAVLSYRLSPSGFGEGGCRRRGAAPQWISG